MDIYRQNKARAIYRNDEPTETDQSQGHETDINVIVGRYGIGQVATGNNPASAMYGDWTEMPTDLREMIETARRIDDHRANLPEQLREMDIQDILRLTPDELTNILTPPAPTPAPPAPPAPSGDNK